MLVAVVGDVQLRLRWASLSTVDDPSRLIHVVYYNIDLQRACNSDNGIIARVYAVLAQLLN
jgi:hypothetical protein